MVDAGLSRGSVLHQFPTRLQLTLGTAEFAMEEMLTSGAELGAQIEDPVERFCSYAEIVWQVHRMPCSIALTDILLASRWDEALATGLKALAENAEQRIDGRYTTLAKEAGVKDIEAVVLHGRLLNASVRGLTMELVFNPSRELTLAALATLKRDYRRFCEHLVKHTK
jgi:AcrR family transcriptional regulator